MSASSKKQLRKEQGAEKLTQKQIAAQKESSTTRLYTVAFVVVLVVLLAIAIFVGVNQTIKNSGYKERHTVAVQIGDHKLSNAELNYFFIDAVNTFYSNYGSYASMFGLDTSKPLDQQVTDEDSGTTWADDFLESAKETARNVYAMSDAAEAAGFTLPEDKAAELEQNLNSIDTYATLYGYQSGNAYLKAMYGAGATKEGLREYSTRSSLADAYYASYSDSLTYTDEQIAEKDAEDPKVYNSYSYHSYYMDISKFRVGGTTDADGNTTYTDEETAAAEAALRAAAKSLVSDDITTTEELDAAIAALSINEGEESAASTASTNIRYSSLNSLYQDWVSDSSRKAGDKQVFESTTTGDEGTESLSGCYVVYFDGSSDNEFKMVNVRHILVKPEHPTDEAEDAHSDDETYSAEEWDAAKATAEEIYDEWKAGEATEDSFAELANEKSDDGDGTTGGLYENVIPGQMVQAFNDWCFDSSRKSGDTGIVKTEYGYHILYFVGLSDITYRTSLIQNDLRTADVAAWQEELVNALTITDGDTSYIKTDLVIGSNS